MTDWASSDLDQHEAGKAVRAALDNAVMVERLEAELAAIKQQRPYRYHDGVSIVDPQHKGDSDVFPLCRLEPQPTQPTQPIRNNPSMDAMIESSFRETSTWPAFVQDATKYLAPNLIGARNEMNEEMFDPDCQCCVWAQDDRAKLERECNDLIKQRDDLLTTLEYIRECWNGDTAAAATVAALNHIDDVSAAAIARAKGGA